MGGNPLRIGILALQGDVREHRRVLEGRGVEVVEVRRAADLEGISGLVIPGGESSVIDKLTRIFELREPLIELIERGLPTLGTCAGLIFLAAEVEDAISGQQTLGVLDITARRNAFGAQRESFEASLSVAGVTGPALEVAFIRAPLVTRVGEGVRVIAALPDSRVVGVETDSLIAVAFHPEITGDPRLHERLVARASQWSARGSSTSSDYTGDESSVA